MSPAFQFQSVWKIHPALGLSSSTLGRTDTADLLFRVSLSQCLLCQCLCRLSRCLSVSLSSLSVSVPVVSLSVCQCLRRLFRCLSVSLSSLSVSVSVVTVSQCPCLYLCLSVTAGCSKSNYVKLFLNISLSLSQSVTEE